MPLRVPSAVCRVSLQRQLEAMWGKNGRLAERGAEAMQEKWALIILSFFLSFSLSTV